MQIKINKVYNMDCLDLMQEMIKQGITVDTLLTDIPYGECNKTMNDENFLEAHHLRITNKDYADTVTFDLQEYLPLVDKIVKGNFIIFAERSK